MEEGPQLRYGCGCISRMDVGGEGPLKRKKNKKLYNKREQGGMALTSPHIPKEK